LTEKIVKIIDSFNQKSVEELHKQMKFVRLRGDTYYRIAAYGTLDDTFDSVINRLTTIAESIIQKQKKDRCDELVIPKVKE
jgi:hypothetical protein